MVPWGNELTLRKKVNNSFPLPHYVSWGWGPTALGWVSLGIVHKSLHYHVSLLVWLIEEWLWISNTQDEQHLCLHHDLPLPPCHFQPWSPAQSSWAFLTDYDYDHVRSAWYISLLQATQSVFSLLPYPQAPPWLLHCVHIVPRAKVLGACKQKCQIEWGCIMGLKFV